MLVVKLHVTVYRYQPTASLQPRGRWSSCYWTHSRRSGPSASPHCFRTRSSGSIPTSASSAPT